MRVKGTAGEVRKTETDAASIEWGEVDKAGGTKINTKKRQRQKNQSRQSSRKKENLQE